MEKGLPAEQARRIHCRWLTVAATLAAVAASVAGCGGASTTNTSTGSLTATNTASTNDAPNGLIIEINGGTVSPFYVAVKQGSDDAAKTLGLSYQYSAPENFNNFVPDMATLIRQAIARHPAGLIIGDYSPSALDPLIKQATSKGIPVLLANAGLPQWQPDGAIGFVGEDPSTGGQGAGTASVQAGVHDLLCVDNATENPAINQRCDGAKYEMTRAKGTEVQLNIPLAAQSNPAEVQQDIQGYLRSHPQIDGVYVAAGSPAPVLAALKALGKTGKVKVGSADLWAGQLQQIRDGQVLFAIEQQPYLQGWYSLLIMDQYLKYHQKPANAIDTGGLAITKANVNSFITVNTDHPNVLGPN